MSIKINNDPLGIEEALSKTSGPDLIQIIEHEREDFLKWAIPIVKEMFERKKIERGKNGYPYVLLPLTDTPKALTVEQMRAISALVICAQVNWEDVDYLFSEADRGGGIILGSLNEKTEKPILLANSESAYNLKEIASPAEVKIWITPPFEGKKGRVLTTNGIKPGDKIVIVDDLLSSGATTVAMIEAVWKRRGEVIAVICIGEKTDQNGRQYLKGKTGFTKIITFIKFITKGRRYTKVTTTGILYA